MWETFDRERQKRKRDLLLKPIRKPKTANIHLKRLPAEIRIGRPLLPPEVIEAVVLTLDLRKETLFFFANSAVEKGTRVSIRIVGGPFGDNGIYLSGTVKVCKRFTLNPRIFHVRPFSYRISVDTANAAGASVSPPPG